MPGYDSICCFRSREAGEMRLLWELTTCCNLDCEFCHRTKPYKYGLSIDEISKLIPVLHEIGVSEIIISGGEPLVRKDIFDIIDLLAKEGFALDLCTNAYAIDETIASELRLRFSEISVSLDSVTEDIHNNMRNKGDAYKKTIEGIKCLLREGISVHVTVLINEVSISHMERTITFLHSIGIKSIALIGEIPVHGGEYYILHDDVQLYLATMIEMIRGKYPDLELNTKEIFPQKGYCNCPAGKTVMSIDVNGYLSPCILLRNAPKVLLTDGDFSDIIKKYVAGRMVT